MRALISVFLLFFCISCSHKVEDPVVAQMRLRKMQSRTFVHKNNKAVANEIISALQDEGFMVKNVSNEFGLITAERDTSVEKFSSKFWAVVFTGKRARWKKHSVVEITANITDEENRTKVRINYLVRVFDNLGRVVDVHQILEEDIYIDFFNRVQKGLINL